MIRSDSQYSSRLDLIGMLFLIFSSADIEFLDQELWWKTYTIEEALPTTRRVELVRKKVFAAAALNSEHETYIVHVVSLNSTPLVASLDSTPFNADIHPSRKPQIFGLIAKEAPTKVADEYANFADVFSHTGINKHAIQLVDLNGFIRLFKSPADAPILFEGQFR